MNNKGGVVLLTVVVSLLCIYYLSFTFVAQRVNQQAIDYATVDNKTDYEKKQQYLDSVWSVPVYNLFGVDFTYKEIKETELNLGLDLQGGMHVTLEVSPVEIVKGISGNSRDETFLKALDMAKKSVKGTQLDFVSEFYSAYQTIAPGQSLATVFATAANRGRISLSTTDEEVLDIINEEVDGAIDRSFNILRTRIDRFGTSQPNIQRLQGTGRIQIELPGVDNPERVRKLLQGVAKLEFWEVHQMQEVLPTLQAMNDAFVKEMKAELPVDADAPAVEETTEDLGDLLGDDTEDSITDSLDTDDLAAQLESDSTAIDSAFNSTVSPMFSLLKAQYGLVYDILDTAQINRMLKSPKVKQLIPSTMKFLWAVKPVKSQDKLSTDEFLELHVIKTSRNGKAPLTGEVISDARPEPDQRQRPAISMNMNAEGARKWKKLTGDNVNRSIAIVLDNYVYSAPNVQGEIPNGSSQITGTFTSEEAKDLANILKAGSLPAPTTIVEDVVIGPTLGKVAQDQGMFSIAAGLGIVILFMIAYYSGGGLIANLALFFNVFFIMGILAQLSAALTLPGIAGIVLTIGMSIDANVLIFERIKEELKNGAGIKQSIASGYSKAYSSIVDANVTTFLVGLILYTLGQGPVKGFAITLMVGIACSFFSAVFITRVIVEWWSNRSDESKVSFTTGLSKNALGSLNIDFISKRKFAYMFSTIFITIGIVAMLIKGLTYGVDFTGGRSYVVTFPSAVESSALKVALAKSVDEQGVEVKTYGASNILKVTTSFMINDESDDADATVKSAVVDGISGFTNLAYVLDDTKMDDSHFTISSSSKVGATIADDIKGASAKSVVVALVVIFLYILVRFRKWQFGLGAIIALFHDTLFVLAAFAIANLFGLSFEVDQVFIAAMLTIIGYSINDTVVVFDRVRENMALKSGVDMKDVFNEALNSTISRTMITSVTTLIVVVVLFFFGGAVLKGFSFALIIGILIGTYSSLFIATPIVIDFNKEKE